MRLDPPIVLSAYRRGAFPMAEEGVIRWFTADPRGVIPLHEGPDGFHIPGTLRQIYRQKRFEIRINTAFRRVMTACTEGRERTWICPELIDAFVKLHEQGHAHSVEAWRDGELAGGLYGVSLGGAFCGESMFHYQPEASKVALVALVERLRERGFALLDAQTRNENMRRFGCIEIPHAEYIRRLEAAMAIEARFD